MRTRMMVGLVVLVAFAAPAWGRDGKYTLKTVEAPPPAQLKESIATLLDAKAYQVLNDKGELSCELWFRKTVPAKATPEQVKNGLGYRDLPESTLFGAVRFPQAAKDYRNQDVPAGVYTLRLGFQPQDGDHMGTAPHPEFFLLIAADRDDKPDPLPTKTLQDLSAKSLGGSHPSMLLLFPNNKPEGTPALADMGMGHWALKLALPVVAGDTRGTLGMALTVIGTSPAAQ